MIAREINFEQFKKAIEVSFSGDNDIYKLYNPLVKVSCIDDIISDIYERIDNDIRDICIKGVYNDNKIAGYYAYSDDTLISFGLSIDLRKRKYLKELWRLIRQDLRGAFQCYLFTRNMRGCKWLLKNGMKIYQQDDLLTHLIF